MSLHIVIPAKSSVNGKCIKCIQDVLTKRPNTTLELFLGKSNIVHARSCALTKWYDQAKEDDMFLFIDSDHVFTEHDITKIVELPDCDVACGIYCGASGDPNAYMVDFKAFMDNSRDNRMLYGATGFMLIRKPVCRNMLKNIEKLDGGTRFSVDDVYDYVIPFFRTRFVDGSWLGEDYAFCWLVRQSGGTIRGFLSNTLGHEVLSIKHFLPEEYTGKTWDRGTIVYVCGNSVETFNPTQTHLGGSEKAVIQLSKRWVNNPAVKGVTVYGNVHEGVYDGVEYKNFETFDVSDQFDTVILWRSFGCRVLPRIKARRILIDLHDSNTIYTDLINVKAHKVFVKSMFHKHLNSSIPDGKICMIPNGIEDNIFEAAREKVVRNPKKFLYASSYTRGLDKILLYCWPRIRALVPDAELHCYYGMKYDDRSSQCKMEQLLANTSGVTDHGRVSIEEVTMAKLECSYHIYLTDSIAEIDCLTIRESAILGCIPLLTREGVFNERLGVFYDMDRSREKESYERIAEEIVGKMKDVRGMIQELARNKEPKWDEVANIWLSLMC